MIDFDDVLIYGLALASFVTILTRTRVPFGWLRKSTNWELIRCPFCISVWFSFSLVFHPADQTWHEYFIFSFAVITVAAIANYWVERYLFLLKDE